MTGVSRTLLALAPAMMLGAGCGTTTPTPTPAVSRVTLVQLSPPGGTIVVPEGTPPGAFIPRGSGLLSVGLSVTSARELPWAQLNVYLLSGDSYCGQNLPDSPTWRPLPSGQTIELAVTGFQVYRLPCDVSGIRAMLHTQDSHVLTPPPPSETVAEATFPASYQLR
jgi:hypothetical protein